MPKPITDLTGQTFGRWTVIHQLQIPRTEPYAGVSVETLEEMRLSALEWHTKMSTR